MTAGKTALKIRQDAGEPLDVQVYCRNVNSNIPVPDSVPKDCSYCEHALEQLRNYWDFKNRRIKRNAFAKTAQNLGTLCGNCQWNHIRGISARVYRKTLKTFKMFDNYKPAECPDCHSLTYHEDSKGESFICDTCGYIKQLK